MAEDKTSIIVYADWIDKFESLSDKEAGQLIKHFFRYVNDKNPELKARVLKMAWHDIEKSLKRDLSKWEGTKKERSESGIIGNLKRWHLDLYNKYINKEISLNEALNIADSRKESHSDNSESLKSQTSLLTDTVNVTEVRKELFKKKVFAFTEYDSNLLENFFNYWSQVNEGGKKMHFEKQKTFEIQRRLITWKNNDFGNKKNGDTAKGNDYTEQM